MSTASEYEPDDEEEEASPFELAVDPEAEEDSDRSVSLIRPKSARRKSLSAGSENDDNSTLRAAQTATSRQRQIRKKGLTKESVVNYRQLLDDMVLEISPVAASESEDLRRNYQHGIVTWTAHEQDIFFDLLSRKGKNGIRDIAQSIGSKSELEVQDYIKILHKGLQHQLHERHIYLITVMDIPAAYEISQDLDIALEELAEYVSLLEQEAENRTGMKKHGDQFWVIDSATADEVEARFDSEETQSSESSIFLTASLLSIKRWTQLSERLFMNFGGSRLEDNWRNICFRDESPSLTTDAFADFYALTVSITRRIVQASIFFAMGRIRNVRHQNTRKVKTRDVRAALDVLNMKHDAFDFYVGLPRRLCLDVADIRHRKGWHPHYMRYDDVEDALSGGDGGSSFRERSVSIYRSDHDVHDEENDQEITNGEDDYNTEDYDRNGSLSSDDETDGHEEDVYAEFVDERADKDEEAHLRGSLACSIIDSLPPLIKDEDRDDLVRPPPRPSFERKTDQDLIDWRERTLYRSEWEEYGHVLEDINEDLAEDRRKRRRIDRDDEPISHKSQHVQLRSSVEYQSADDDEDDNGDDEDDHGDEDDDDDDNNNNDGGENDDVDESEAETEIQESIERHGVEMENVVIRHTVDDLSDEAMADSDPGG